MKRFRIVSNGTAFRAQLRHWFRWKFTGVYFDTFEECAAWIKKERRINEWFACSNIGCSGKVEPDRPCPAPPQQPGIPPMPFLYAPRPKHPDRTHGPCCKYHHHD